MTELEISILQRGSVINNEPITIVESRGVTRRQVDGSFDIYFLVTEGSGYFRIGQDDNAKDFQIKKDFIISVPAGTIFGYSGIFTMAVFKIPVTK